MCRGGNIVQLETETVAQMRKNSGTSNYPLLQPRLQLKKQKKTNPRMSNFKSRTCQCCNESVRNFTSAVGISKLVNFQNSKLNPLGQSQTVRWATGKLEVERGQPLQQEGGSRVLKDNPHPPHRHTDKSEQTPHTINQGTWATQICNYAYGALE